MTTMQKHQKLAGAPPRMTGVSGLRATLLAQYQPDNETPSGMPLPGTYVCDETAAAPSGAVNRPTAPHQKYIEPPAFLALPYWTTEETAEYLRCEAQSIRKAISQKGNFHDLKPRRFGRRWYFSASDVRSKLEAA